MGITRTDLYTEHQNDLALIAKAFAHPARIAILQHLLKVNACINSDLVGEIGLAQATISQHLRALRDSGLVCGTIEGPRVNYCINPVRWQAIKMQFLRFFDQFEAPGQDNCS